MTPQFKLISCLYKIQLQCDLKPQGALNMDGDSYASVQVGDVDIEIESDEEHDLGLGLALMANGRFYAFMTAGVDDLLVATRPRL